MEKHVDNDVGKYSELDGIMFLKKEIFQTPESQN